MKKYTFSFEESGEQITIATFSAINKKEAKKYAILFKQRELKKNYPFVKLNKVRIK
jgi:hypothetical protein